MRVIEISGTGGPDVLQLTKRDYPTGGPQDVVIRVSAAGLNRADILQRKGLYPAPQGASDIPGLEVAGTIDAVGPAVTRWKVGDIVCALLPGGGYAEYAVAHENLCAPIPKNISVVEAASLPESLFTVWNNVFIRGRLRATETLLVHGGTSGIGSMAIQMASVVGATVYATTSNNGKKQHCLRFGARQAISRLNENYISVLNKLVPDGINVVLDMIGGDMLASDFEVMATDGRHVSIAHMDGKTATIDIPTLMKKRLILTGSTLRGRPIEELSALARDLDKNIWPLVSLGKIKPVVERTFPFEEAAAAHKFMESGQHIGKIVLTL